MTNRLLRTVAGLSVVVSVGATMLAATTAPASASTTNGTATIDNQGLTARLTGAQSSSQSFGVSLPAGAACSGDSASQGYRVVSYMIPQAVYGTNGATLQSAVSFTNGFSNIGLGYFTSNGNEFQGGSNTAPVSGQIITGSGPYAWSPGLVPQTIPLVSPSGLSSAAAYQDGLIPSASASQSWETGIACINPSGHITDWWNAEITVTPVPVGSGAGQDPNGYVWTPSPTSVAVTSVAPSTLAQGATATVVIKGSGFVSTPKVTVSGTAVSATVTSWSPSSVTITARVAATAALGARNVTVADHIGSASCTGCLTVTPAPTLTSASPAQLAVGASGTVTFTGTHFAAGATVRISGPSTKVTATAQKVVGTTTLTAKITVPAGTPTGAYTVTVTNPDHSSATCTTCFKVIAAPTLASMSPSTVARGTSTPVTLTGTGFASGAVATGPSGVTFTNVLVKNATTITATMTVSATAAVGTNLPVTVTNSAAAGQGKATRGLLKIT